MKKAVSTHGPEFFFSLILIVLLLASPLPAAQPAGLDASTTSRIDSFLRSAYPADQPGAAVLIARGNQVLFREAYGMANLEQGIPLRPDMVFRLGSITKQFTAASILLLEEEGKLKVSDPITKYLPKYPVHGHNITIEHLLNHTSGIFSYTGIPNYMNSEIRRDLTTEELVAVFKNLPMDFAPGDRYRYNNSGYVLLGAIIEAVSGKSYPDFVQERIFTPLGMSHSHYGGLQLIPGRVSGYEGTPGNYSNAKFLSMTQPQAAGSLLSNVDDLLRWNLALTSGDVVSPAGYKRMTTRGHLNDGSPIRYGYGLGLGNKVRGRDVVAHGGGINGFSTTEMFIPEEQIYITVLTNIPGRLPSPGLVANKLAAHALGDPYPEFETRNLPPAVLARYEGTYEFEGGAQRTLKVRDGKLYSERDTGPEQEAKAAGETTFFFYPLSLTYFEMVLDSSGQVTGMKVYQNGEGEPELARRVKN